jgi:hypothetical protein
VSGAPTAVVHLVRAANGLAPFEAFLASYAAHEAGLAHDLVLLFKGFGRDPGRLAPYRELAGDRAAAEVHVSDEGLDLTAYLAAARQLPHERLCFLNSYSTIVAPRWLALLSAALDAPSAGVVGATGSWGSHRSFALYLLRLPGPYSAVLDDRAALAPAFRSVGPAARVGRLHGLLKAALDLPREIHGYGSFPAPHVRTNAFMLDRELLLSLSAGPLKSKSAAYRFEGGTRGLTAQVRARGLDALLVGRDGEPLRPDRWPDADLFWQRRQSALLVADNQTRAYADGTPDERRALSRYAWGDRAQAD